MTHAFFDPGLQPERTELAWRRTALATAVGSLVAMRLLPAALGDPLWVVPGVVGLVVSGAIWVRARARYLSSAPLLESGRLDDLPDGRLLFALALVVVGIGVLGLVVFTV